MKAFSFKDVSIHSKSVQDLAWNIDGSQLGTASSDRTVKISSIEPQGSYKVIQSITTTGIPMQMKWNPSDKTRFAIAGDDIMIDVWDVRAPKPAIRLASLAGNIYIAWSPNNRYLASVNKSDVLMVHDVLEGRTVKELRFTNEINEISWSCNSDYIFVASGLGGLQLVHVHEDSLEIVTFIAAHTASCHYLKVWDPIDERVGSHDRAVMALGGTDFQVTLWDVDDLICYNTISSETDIRGICISPDGNFVAVAADESCISFYETKTAKLVAKAESRMPFSVLAWHPSLNLLAVTPDERSNVGSGCHLRLLSFSTAT